MDRAVGAPGSLPTLSTARTTLRALVPGDAGALHRVFSDPEAMRYWSTPAHGDETETAAMIASIRAGFEQGQVLQWGIERDHDQSLLGTVTLLPAAGQPRAELGFILGSEHWGRGYAGEAQRRVVEFAFSELGMRRLEADTHPGNEASARSLERLGFRREGLLRERWTVAGEVSDSVLWGLLERDWRTRATAG